MEITSVKTTVDPRACKSCGGGGGNDPTGKNGLNPLCSRCGGSGKEDELLHRAEDAYNAYGTAIGWKEPSGRTVLPWRDLTSAEWTAWRAAIVVTLAVPTQILVDGLVYHEHDGHNMPKKVARDALVALGIRREEQP